MSKLRIEGSFVASITPFNQNGEVEFGAFRTLLDFQENRAARPCCSWVRPASRRC